MTLLSLVTHWLIINVISGNYFFVIYFFIVVQVQLSPYSPHHSHPSQPSPLPTLYPTPFWLCPCVHYTCFLTTLTPLPPLAPSTSPVVTISLFLFSVSLVIFCLLACFVDYVPLIGEIIWYLSFTAWFVSLTIMLSSSIHAVAKGRSSFFLSAV